jgi:predicted flap endonuclease-1-like 5' DNA nuclease
MATQKADYSCAVICWGIGVLLGVMTTAGLMVVGWSFLQGAFMGILAWLIVGGFLSVAVCGTRKSLATPVDSRAKLEAEMAAARARVQGGAPVPSKTAPAASPAPEAAKPDPNPAAKPAPKPAATPVEAGKEAGSKVKASVPLAGEADLAQRKGDWKYENGDAAPAASAPDGKPASLSAPRDGGADDLKKIKGVGPKLEQLLHRLGFFHFDQIASWSASDVAWVDDNLEGFKGRATRDEWVAQAAKLASGGETEFSKRVDDGDVY